jgi:hypothetical protein
VLRIFIALKNSSPWPGFELATFGLSGQYSNRYTIKTTSPSSNVSKTQRFGNLIYFRPHAK